MTLSTIQGMHDVLPADSGRWRWLEERARSVFERFGYGEIRTPTLERTEVFARSLGETTDIVEKEMYTFAGSGDETYTMRPEGTASVVRAYVQHGLAVSAPLSRLYYLGPMYRRERPQRGRYRQFHQIGAEVLGAGSAQADVEIVAMLWAFLEEVGVEGVTLELTSLGCRVCRPAYLDVLRAYAAPRADRLCESCRRRLERNPLRLLDCKVESCREEMADAPVIVGHLCAECRTHHQGVEEGLGDLGVPFVANPRIVRGLDYYVRTAFEVTTDRLGAQNAVAGGGRYDGLVAVFGGPDVAGVGFALGVERILELAGAAPAELPPVVVVSHGPDADRAGARLAWALRRAGRPVLRGLDPASMKSQLRRANKAGARFVLLLGEQELAEDRVTVKDLARQEQASCPGDPAAVLAHLEATEARAGQGEP